MQNVQEQKILIFSRCIKIIPKKGWVFHFRGIYRGQSIQNIFIEYSSYCGLENQTPIDFIVGDDYLLWGTENFVHNYQLNIHLIKYRRADAV